MAQYNEGVEPCQPNRGLPQPCGNRFYTGDSGEDCAGISARLSSLAEGPAERLVGCPWPNQWSRRPIWNAGFFGDLNRLSRASFSCQITRASGTQPAKTLEEQLEYFGMLTAAPRLEQPIRFKQNHHAGPELISRELAGLLAV